MTTDVLHRPLRIGVVSLNVHPFAADDDSEVPPRTRLQREYVAGLVRSIADRGDAVALHTVAASRTAVPDGVEVHESTSAGQGAATCLELLEAAKQDSEMLLQAWSQDPPDVVHAHFWTSGLAAELAARELSVPVVQSLYGVDAAVRRPAGDDKERRARLQLASAVARNGQAVIAMSSADADALYGLGVDRAVTRVVPPGFDAVSPPVGSRMPDVAAGLRVLALVDRGDSEAVEELGWVAQRVNRIRLAVRHPGSPPDLSDLIGESDVVVALTGSDAPAGPVLQAMASGRPVVSVEGGPAGDAVVDDVTGILVRRHHRRDLVRALLRLVDDPCTAEAMGQAGYDRVATRYTWSRIAEESLAVLSSARR